MDKRYARGSAAPKPPYSHDRKGALSGGENRIVGMMQGELRLRIKGQPGVGWRYVARVRCNNRRMVTSVDLMLKRQYQDPGRGAAAYTAGFAQ